MNVSDAERLVDELLTAELAKQNQMWGHLNERADVSQDQLLHAGIAQLDALFDRLNGDPTAFDEAPAVYPIDWSGFRDYGSNVANIIVAAAFLLQDAKRRILNGEDTTRTSRRPDQAYNAATGLPNPIEA